MQNKLKENTTHKAASILRARKHTNSYVILRILNVLYYSNQLKWNNRGLYAYC